MTPLLYRIGVMKKQSRTFTINELSALVEMSKRTIRYYIQNCLVERPEGVGKGAMTNKPTEAVEGQEKEN